MGQNATCNLIFLGLGRPWVGEFVGFIMIFTCFPTQQSLVSQNTLLMLRFVVRYTYVHQKRRVLSSKRQATWTLLRYYAAACVLASKCTVRIAVLRVAPYRNCFIVCRRVHKTTGYDGLRVLVALPLCVVLERLSPPEQRQPSPFQKTSLLPAIANGLKSTLRTLRHLGTGVFASC